MRIAGIDLELYDQGKGDPLLFLHSAQGFDPRHEISAMLASRRRLVAPSHPGFGKSTLPDWLDSVDDIAYVYLELMDELKLRSVDLVGCSIGGWIAAEMATKAPERFRSLVLVGPVGVKTGTTDRLDIPDIFAMPQDKVDQLLFADPAKMKMDPSKMTDDEIAIRVRNRETLALIAWEPWMHNPKLPHRLQRAAMPTLLIRGEKDGLVSAPYLERYSKLFPRARLQTIAGAGHAPQAEQPRAFADALFAFLEAK